MVKSVTWLINKGKKLCLWDEKRSNMNVLKQKYWGSYVLNFTLNWGWAMFLRCSYFFGNLSLNVLINMVLTQIKECIQTALFVMQPSSVVHWRTTEGLTPATALWWCLFLLIHRRSEFQEWVEMANFEVTGEQMKVQLISRTTYLYHLY